MTFNSLGPESKLEGLTLTVNPNDKGPGVIIRPDGKIEYPEGLDAAALKFWEAVEKAYPAFMAASALVSFRPQTHPRPWLKDAAINGIPLDLILTQNHFRDVKVSFENRGLGQSGVMRVHVEWVIPTTHSTPEVAACRCCAELKPI